MRVEPRFTVTMPVPRCPLASIRTSSMPVWKTTETGVGFSELTLTLRLFDGLSRVPSNLTVTLHLPTGTLRFDRPGATEQQCGHREGWHGSPQEPNAERLARLNKNSHCLPF